MASADRRGQMAVLWIAMLMTLGVSVAACFCLGSNSLARQRRLESTSVAAARCIGALVVGPQGDVACESFELEAGVPGVFVRASHLDRTVSLAAAGRADAGISVAIDYEGRPREALVAELKRARESAAHPRAVYGDGPLERLARSRALRALDGADRELVGRMLDRGRGAASPAD